MKTRTAAAPVAPAHTYDVYVAGNLSLSTRYWVDVTNRLHDLRRAAGPVTLTIDGHEVNGATLAQLYHDTATSIGYREPTQAELINALTCSR